MKKIIYTILSATIILLASCGGNESSAVKEITSPETAVAEELVEETTTNNGAEAGKELFSTNGCVACHQVDAKTVGPSLKEISIGYADNTKGLTAFLKDEGKAIIDPSQAAVMQPQLAITKAMSEQELNNVIDYILSNK